MPTTAGARSRILDAAEALLRSIGLARTTTKEIAARAGCSEAAIYKHFASKEDVFVAVLNERLPPLDMALDGLDQGDEPLEQRLARIAAVACAFYESTFAIAASLFAEPALLARHRAALGELGAGPHVPIRRLAELLAQAAARGEIRADADVDAASSLLLGACLQRAFLGAFSPPAPKPRPAKVFGTRLAATVVAGLRPAP